MVTRTIEYKLSSKCQVKNRQQAIMARAHQGRLYVIQQESRNLETDKVFTETNLGNYLL